MDTFIEILNLLDEVRKEIPDNIYLSICNNLQKAKLYQDELSRQVIELKHLIPESDAKWLEDCSVCSGDLDESHVLPELDEREMYLLANGSKCKYFEALGPKHRDVWVIKRLNDKFVVKAGFPHQCNHEFFASPEYETLEIALHGGTVWLLGLDEDDSSDDEHPPLVGG